MLLCRTQYRSMVVEEWHILPKRILDMIEEGGVRFPRSNYLKISRLVSHVTNSLKSRLDDYVVSKESGS
jgi:hypothetical protein